MRRPWNPFAYTPLGHSAALPAPVRIVVVGPPLSAPQQAFAQAAFASFCAQSRLSHNPSPVKNGKLPDGCTYQITEINHQRSMTVWNKTGGSQAVFADCGILVDWDSGISRGQYLFQPGGSYQVSDGNWRVKVVKDWTGGTSTLILSTFSPDWRASWHSAVTKEYYVAMKMGAIFYRSGKAAVRWTVPVSQGLAKILTTSTGPHFVSFTSSTGILKSYIAKYLNVDVSQIREPVLVDSYSLLKNLNLGVGKTIKSYCFNHSGSALLLSVEAALSDVGFPPSGIYYDYQRYPIPDVFYDQFGNFSRRFKYLVPYTKSADFYKQVEEYQLNPADEWRLQRVVSNPEIGSSYPLAVVRSSGGLVTVLDDHAWEATWPTKTSREGDFGQPCDPDSFKMYEILMIETRGHMNFREWCDFDSGEYTQDGTESYGYGGQPVVPLFRRKSKFEAIYSGEIAGEAYGNVYCYSTDRKLGVASNEHGWDSEVSTMTREYTDGTTVNLNGKILVLKEIKYKESSRSNCRKVRGRYKSEPNASTVQSFEGGCDYSVNVLEREIVVFDAQLDFLCYTEFQYAYERTTTGSYEYWTGTPPGFGPYQKKDGSGGGQPPAVPLVYLVIECQGRKTKTQIKFNAKTETVQSYMIADVPVSYIPTKDGGGPLPEDSFKASEAALLYEYIYHRIYDRTPDPLRRNPNVKINSGRTSTQTRLSYSRAVMTPGTFIENIAVSYAKDPRTGAAIAWLKPNLSSPIALAIDSTGVRNLNEIFSKLPAADIKEVSPA